MPLIHLEVPDELNKSRKNLNVTWRDVIKAGLEALKSPNPTTITTIRPHLIAASKSIKAVDDILKGVINHE